MKRLHPQVCLVKFFHRCVPKDVVALRESLNGIQLHLKQQHEQIMALKDDMHTLQLKMNESDLSFRTNKKLQQVSSWKSIGTQRLI